MVLGYSATQNFCLMTSVSCTHRAAIQKCRWFLRSPLPLGGLKLLGKNLNSKGRETRKYVIFKQLLQVCGFSLRNKTESDGPFLASPPVLGLHVLYHFLFVCFFLCMPCGTKESGKKLLLLKSDTVPFKCELKQRDMKL